MKPHGSSACSPNKERRSPNRRPHAGTMESDSLSSLAPHGHGESESATPWDVNIELKSGASSQGAPISESAAHAGTMRSDSLSSLAPHGHAGSESATPWGGEHRTEERSLFPRSADLRIGGACEDNEKRFSLFVGSPWAYRSLFPLRKRLRPPGERLGTCDRVISRCR